MSIAPLKDWFGAAGAGKNIVWIIVVLIGAGVAWGQMDSKVSDHGAEINRLDAKTNYLNEQLHSVKEDQSGIKADISNIKDDVDDIKEGINDVKKILMGNVNKG